MLLNNSGFDKVNIGDTNEAISDYNKAISLNPSYPEAYNNRGFAYAAKGDLDQAITDYNKANELDFMEAYNNRGLAYIVTTLPWAFFLEKSNDFNKYK